MCKMCGSHSGAAIGGRVAILLAGTNVSDNHTARYFTVEVELQPEDWMTQFKKQFHEAYCTAEDISGTKYQMELLAYLIYISFTTSLCKALIL